MVDVILYILYKNNSLIFYSFLSSKNFVFNILKLIPKFAWSVELNILYNKGNIYDLFWSLLYSKPVVRFNSLKEETNPFFLT